MTIIGLPGQKLISKEKHVQCCLDFTCYLSSVGPRDKKCNSRLFISLPPWQVPRDGLHRAAREWGPRTRAFQQPEKSGPRRGESGTAEWKPSLLTSFLAKKMAVGTMATDTRICHLISSVQFGLQSLHST